MEGAEVVKGGKNERDEASSSSPAKPESPVASMADYDPNRIPSSVFSNKSGTEWSVTSNDSLFSIQMGNNSFSTDYAIMYGKSGDVDPQLKSGELPRLDEWSNNNRQAAPAKSSEVNSLPPVMEQEEGSLQSGESSSRAGKKEGGSPHVSQSPPPTAFRPPVSPTLNPRISDVSANSNKSFAFPVLVSESGKKEESIRVGAEKGESRAPQTQAQEEPQAQAQAQAHKPNRWFSCFSCARPRCC